MGFHRKAGFHWTKKSLSVFEEIITIDNWRQGCFAFGSKYHLVSHVRSVSFLGERLRPSMEKCEI